MASVGATPKAKVMIMKRDPILKKLINLFFLIKIFFPLMSEDGINSIPCPSEQGRRWESQIERPLKDGLLLQGPNRGFFVAEDPHFYTSIFMVCPMNAKVVPK
jgi:hypothetical protein